MTEPVCVGRNKVATAKLRAYGIFPTARLFDASGNELSIGSLVEWGGRPHFINTIEQDGITLATPGTASPPFKVDHAEMGLTIKVRRDPVYRAFHRESGLPVEIGDQVQDFRGNTFKLVQVWEKRVVLEMVKGYREAGYQFAYEPAMFGLKIEEEKV